MHVGQGADQRYPHTLQQTCAPSGVTTCGESFHDSAAMPEHRNAGVCKVHSTCNAAMPEHNVPLRRRNTGTCLYITCAATAEHRNLSVDHLVPGFFSLQLVELQTKRLE